MIFHFFCKSHLWETINKYSLLYSTMEGKKTAGRQKIPLEKIKKEANRYASFSKRRSGLYKKASELVRECGVDLGIVLSSPTGKPYSFAHPTTDAVIDRFINPTRELDLGAQLVAAEVRNSVIQNNGRLNEFDAREKAAKEKIRSIDQMNEARTRGWWESMDQLNAKDITKFEDLLDITKVFLNVQLKQLENGASYFLQSPPEDADN
ncbi:agamous-like MADS-box protein AGL29 [Solanum dulcamara]|uniref:agamous-like MADS-box protein AGL29 n=1 Tax=Solanum dulcamara TaxID=45834 RepID=UPI002484FEB7|nr:agamous-like MADS-box protein AGL29 [Solanum dulcamara]